MRALDAAGLAWGAPVTVDSAGDVGQYASLALVGGIPAIAYYDATNTRLKYARALDAAGATWGAPQVLDEVPGDDIGQYCSLAVIGGLPAVAYTDTTIGDVRYIRAIDANGAAWNVPQSNNIQVPVVGKQYFSLIENNGHIGLAHLVAPGATSRLGYSNSSDLSAPYSLVSSYYTADLTAGVGQGASLKTVNGQPAIAYRGATGMELRYIRATDPFGISFLSPPVIVDATTEVGIFISMALNPTRPAIAYYDQAAANEDLVYRHASDSLGASWSALERVDTTGNVGQYCSLDHTVTSQPAISYYDATNGDLKFSRYI